MIKHYLQILKVSSQKLFINYKWKIIALQWRSGRHCLNQLMIWSLTLQTLINMIIRPLDMAHWEGYNIISVLLLTYKHSLLLILKLRGKNTNWELFSELIRLYFSKMSRSSETKNREIFQDKREKIRQCWIIYIYVIKLW